jgi:hypothetical protein
MHIANDVPPVAPRRDTGLYALKGQRQCVRIELGRRVGALHRLAAGLLHKRVR